MTAAIDERPPPRAGPTCEPVTVRAKHIMSRLVTAVSPTASVGDIARLLCDKGFSALPVLDHGVLVGIVSEGDLLRRDELGAGRSGRSHARQGRSARDVMTSNVIAVDGEAPMLDIARTMQRRRIRQIPVVDAGKLVGIVSRKDIVRVLAARSLPPHPPLSCDDDVLRMRVFEVLFDIPGASAWQTTVSVSNGAVTLAGVIEDENAREPSAAAVRQLLDVVSVEDRRSVLQPY